MKALITSCGRPDLLLQTLKSFLDRNKYRKWDGEHTNLQIHFTIHEDGNIWLESEEEYEELNRVLYDTFIQTVNGYRSVYTDHVGQHASIEKFLSENNGEKYYLHLEEDWLIDNSYNWIQASIDIMEQDPRIIKVLAREGSPHPCVHDCSFNGVKYGYLHPWINKGIDWAGFSWNPGVTRLDLLKKFEPFPKWEQYLAKNIHAAGYKVVELATPVYRHIGDGRSTHE